MDLFEVQIKLIQKIASEYHNITNNCLRISNPINRFFLCPPRVFVLDNYVGIHN